MRLYSENENYKLYHGNMLDMLEVIESNSIDSIVTDPPYGLTSITKRFGKENSAECQYGKDGSFQRLSKGFMGKEWDGSGIEYNIDTWRKCYEVLKSGGYLLAFGGSRTFHRIACAIEDAGFEIRDTIMWLYGSGFPKSMDISKQLDKRNGRTNDKFIELGNYLKEKIIDTDNMCAEKIGFSPALVRFWKLGERIPNKETWLKLKSIYGLDNDFDWLIEREEAEREVIGTKEVMGKDTADIYGKYKGGEVDITIPKTDLAKQWQGWGTALKPSFEPIIVARKPFKGSLVDNIIENGVGGINIDECRVAFNGDKWKNQKSGNTAKAFNLNEQQREAGTGVLAGYECEANENGRFPANTILTYDETDFDEVCGGFPNTKQNGSIKNPNLKNSLGKNIYHKYSENQPLWESYKDSGSASRYFMNCKYTGKDEEFRRYIYTPKASKKDRDEGLDTFVEEKVNDGRQTPIDNAFQRGETLRRNVHPCVKPTNLMQYLVRLVTPNNGTVLDPFNGSGSTGKAVMYENHERDKNYKYVGIELTEEYLPISKARIEYVCNLPKEQKQSTIFDYLGDDNNE